MELDTRFGDHADPPVHDIMAQELIRVQVCMLQISHLPSLRWRASSYLLACNCQVNNFNNRGANKFTNSRVFAI